MSPALSPPVRELELTFAAEATAYAEAMLELNPFGEAEVLPLGAAYAVYSGAVSAVHGVFGLGLDGPVEERDLREVERFFFHKERPPAFWLTPATDSSLLALLGRGYHATKTLPLHGASLNGGLATLELPEPIGSSAPEHSSWPLQFTRSLDPEAKEPSLFALAKLHQKNTRFYSTAAAASYTFFAYGIALVPMPPTHSLFALQAKEACEFKSSWLAAGPRAPLPFLYERTLYEPL